MNIFYKIPAALLLVLGSQVALAQENNTVITPATIETREQGSFWKKSKNAAGLQLDQPVAYSKLSAGFESYEGNYHRPQQGRSGNRQLVQTAGNLFVGDYFLSGSFNYTRDNIKEASFNASIIDPFRGMPFIVADLVASDWNNQHYDMQFKIATPKFNDQWAFGLAVDYKVSSGAKQRDLRAENYYYAIAVAPGVVYSPSDQHHFGLNLNYSNFKEQSDISRMNTTTDQIYYDLLGLGMAISNSGLIDRTNNYEGDIRGAGIQYHYQGKLGVLVSADYSEEAEDLEVSFSTPRNAGSALRKIWNGSVMLSAKGTRLSHFLDLNYYKRDIDGIQYVTQRDNSSSQLGWQTLFKSIRSTYASQKAGAQYHLLINRGEAYSWKLNAGVVYEKLNDVYLLPNSVKQAKNTLFTLGVKKNFKLSDSKDKHLLLGVELSANTNISGKYEFNGPHPDYPVVNDLERSDLNYLISDYTAVAIPVVYSQKFKEGSNTDLFVKANAHLLNTSSFWYSNRKLFSLSIGANF